MAKTWFRLLMIGCMCSSSAWARDKHASHGHEHSKHTEAPKAAAPIHYPSPAPQPVHHSPTPAQHHSSSASHRHVEAQPTHHAAPAAVPTPVVPIVSAPAHHQTRHHSVEVARPVEAPRPAPPMPARPVAGPLPAAAMPDRLANVPVIPTKTVEVHRPEKTSHATHETPRPSIGHVPSAAIPSPVTNAPVVTSRPTGDVGHRHESHGTHSGSPVVGAHAPRPTPTPVPTVAAGVVTHRSTPVASHVEHNRDSGNHHFGNHSYSNHGKVAATALHPTHVEHHHNPVPTHHSSSHHSGSSSFFIRLGSSNWNRDHFCHHHFGPSPVVTRTVVVPVAPPPQTIFVSTPVATTIVDSRDVIVAPPTLDPAGDLPPPERIVPTADEFALLSSADQLRMMKMATDGLRLDLSEHENGRGWIEFLKLDFVAGWIERDDRLDAAVMPDVASLADRFEQVSRDEKLQGVSELIGFQILKVGLREVSLPPRLKTVRSIRWMASDLAAQLSGLTTTDQWRSYLRLERLARLDATSIDDLALREELALTLDRFERLTVEPRYSVVWQKPAFDPLRQTLARFLSEPIE